MIKKIWKLQIKVNTRHVNKSFELYDGKKFVLVNVTKEMVGYKFGDFVFTKKYGSSIHKIKK